MGFEVKKGQATIWIILAIIILALIILLFYFRGQYEPVVLPSGDPVNERSFMEICVGSAVEEAVGILLPRGGLINPVNFRMYNETPVAFLCENKGYYEPCIQQHPLLVKEIEMEIDRYISPRIDSCFSELKSENEREGIETILGPGAAEVSVGLGQDSVAVKIGKPVTFIEKGETRTVSSFDYVVADSVYNLAVIALEIAAQEAEYCYFEYIGYSLFYPRYKIKPFGISDSVIIYQIIDSKSGQKMNIAIRSCAIPAGI